MNKIHHSSNKDDWCTPPWLFNLLNDTFDKQIKIDLCATKENSLAEYYLNDIFTDEIPKKYYNTFAFCNPPYRRKSPNTWDFVKRCEELTSDPYNLTIIMLLPARTDVMTWHDTIIKRCMIHFIKGRLKFISNGVEHKHPAPFPSAVCIMSKTTPGNMGYSICKNEQYFIPCNPYRTYEFDYNLDRYV